MDAFTAHGILARSARATLIGLAAIVVSLIVAHGTASASEVPADVEDAFGADDLQQLKQLSAGQHADDPDYAPDFSVVVGFGTIHQVYQWSPEFLAGDASSAPAALQEWVAPLLLRDGSAVGVYRVWRPDAGAVAEFAGFNDDSEIATGLSTLAPEAMAVEDPTIAAWYGIVDQQISGLNSQARRELPVPSPVRAFAPIVAERHALQIKQAAGHEDSIGGAPIVDRPIPAAGARPWVIAGGVTLIVLGAIGVLWFRRRRPMPGTDR